MKPRFPLYAKILTWLFLNLLLLVAIAFLMLQGQSRFWLDLLIAGRGGERIQGLANGLAAELSVRAHDEWDTILKNFGGGYGVQLMLLRPDGALVAGEKIELPREVNERLRERLNSPFPRNNPNFRPQNEPGEESPRPPFDRPREGRPDQTQRPFGEHRRIEPPRDANGPASPPAPPEMNEARPLGQGHVPALASNQIRPRFMMHTSNPARYWVGLPMPQLDPQRPQARLTLVAVSTSIRGGGLFFDFRPWLLAAGVVVLFSILFWLPLVRGITRAVSQLTRATGEIAEGRFDTRVPERRRDELGALAAAVNRMADRLAGFITGQKRFLGDTAHELCAPIARMQMALGVLEQRADEKQKPYVRDVAEELQHISGLVNELLSFSKAGLRPQPAAIQAVSVAEIANRIAEREGKAGDKIEVAVEPNLQVMAEPELLCRAIANLVRNALRYAGDAGPVRISATQQDARVVIAISDEGPGVPDEALQKIFDPFYRIEESRSRETGGVGLGLAIVKTCIEACDGTVSAHNRIPHGLEVRIGLRSV